MNGERSMRIANLFANAAAPATGERFEALLTRRNLVVERILSSSDVTPTTYTQAQDQWVLLLRGRAVLEVEGEHHTLVRGDYLFLPASTPHTVREVEQDTLWLAVHLH